LSDALGIFAIFTALYSLLSVIIVLCQHAHKDQVYSLSLYDATNHFYTISVFVLNDIKDEIIRDYNSIITESAPLTTISGFLFRFLLNISLNMPRGFSPLDSIVLIISLFAITLAKEPQIHQIWHNACHYYFVSRFRPF
jgi:hypothetical protein